MPTVEDSSRTVSRQFKKTIQQGRSERRTGGVVFLTRPPKLPRQLVLHVGYVEDLSDARTMLGEKRVSARGEW
jgi:hypothetical protein